MQSLVACSFKIIQLIECDLKVFYIDHLIYNIKMLSFK